MNCVICKRGGTAAGQANVVLQRADTTIVIKGVPADVCENCGEYYLSQEITGRVLGIAAKAAANGAEIEIVRYAA